MLKCYRTFFFLLPFSLFLALVFLVTVKSYADPLCLPAGDVEAVYSAPDGIFGEPNHYVGPATTIRYGQSPREDAEAEFLAFTMRDSLLANESDYQRIKQELETIRSNYEELSNVRYHGNYGEGQLLIEAHDGLEDSAEFSQANLFFGLCEDIFVTEVIPYPVHLRLLKFPARMNIPMLAEHYQSDYMSNIYSSYPNVIFNLEDYIYVSSGAPDPDDASFTSAEQAGNNFHYVFEDGFLDCIDGCDCKHFFEFTSLETGGIVLTDQYVDYGSNPAQIAACLDYDQSH